MDRLLSEDVFAAAFPLHEVSQETVSFQHQFPVTSARLDFGHALISSSGGSREPWPRQSTCMASAQEGAGLFKKLLIQPF